MSYTISISWTKRYCLQRIDKKRHGEEAIQQKGRKRKGDFALKQVTEQHRKSFDFKAFPVFFQDVGFCRAFAWWVGPLRIRAGREARQSVKLLRANGELFWSAIGTIRTYRKENGNCKMQRGEQIWQRDKCNITTLLRLDRRSRLREQREKKVEKMWVMRWIFHRAI